MAFNNRKEYVEWMNGEQCLNEESDKYYNHIPECEECNYQDKIIAYQKYGHSEVDKICRICLGLGKYSKK